MPNVPIGKQSHDGSRTPTLREFLKSGRTCPRNCGVTIIFKPNKTQSFGIVTESGFRVSVNSGSELYDAIDDEISGWIEGGAYLVVCPDTSKPGQFSLEVDTNESAVWKEYDWGYKLTVEDRPKTARSRKKPTSVSREARMDDDVPMM